MSGRRLAQVLLVACYLPLAGSASGDVVLDGSLGSAELGTALEGPEFSIEEEFGEVRGGNLFHSFSDFSIAEDQGASFLAGENIENILARVTGDDASNLDGTLRAPTNLFLFNPNGVIFGPTAALEVQGDFHASTADYLKFDDGMTFRADAGALTLSVSPPSAFGFLGPAAPINVTGSELRGFIESGNSLEGQFSLIGGDITLDGAFMATLGGRVNLASVASAGEVGLEDDGLDASNFETLGRIRIVDSQLATSGLLSSERGGDVFVRGESLQLVDSELSTLTLGDEDGGDVDIDIRGDLILDQVLRKTGIELGTGRELSPNVFQGGRGSGGNLTAHADRILISGGAQIVGTTFTFLNGNGGNIALSANRSIRISGVGADAPPGTARGGVFSRAANAFSGQTGQVDLDAPDIRIGEQGVVVVENRSNQDAKGISVRADHLEIASGGRLDTSTRGRGRGGTIQIAATESVVVDGNDSDALTGITTFAQQEAFASPGSITIDAPSVSIVNRGEVSATSRALRMDESQGNATDVGNVTINADILELANQGVIETANLGIGKAGVIDIDANRIELGGGSSISSEASVGEGGQVDIRFEDRIQVFESRITTSVAGGDGSGGAIAIRGGRFVILRNSQVVAEADGGVGGSIDIAAEALVVDSLSQISTLSVQNEDGDVLISAPEVDLVGGLESLPTELEDPTQLLQARCGVRGPEAASVFVAEGADELGLDPDSALRAPTEGGSLADVAAAPGAPNFCRRELRR